MKKKITHTNTNLNRQKIIHVHKIKITFENVFSCIEEYTQWFCVLCAIFFLKLNIKKKKINHNCVLFVCT